MKAVITVVGKDTVGILATVSNECAKNNVNILDVSQTILQDMFCMIMICNIDAMNIKFSDFSKTLREIGTKRALSINAMHEDIFNSMHRI